MPKLTLPSEYKREYAELVIVHGYKHKDAAAAMDVGLSSIQRWVSQYRKEQ
jgi:transposase